MPTAEHLNTTPPAETLAERVRREAAEAVALPWWFWEAAIAVVIATLALSAAFPMGVAP